MSTGRPHSMTTSSGRHFGPFREFGCIWPMITRSAMRAISLSRSGCIGTVKRMPISFAPAASELVAKPLLCRLGRNSRLREPAGKGGRRTSHQCGAAILFIDQVTQALVNLLPAASVIGWSRRFCIRSTRPVTALMPSDGGAGLGRAADPTLSDELVDELRGECAARIVRCGVVLTGYPLCIRRRGDRRGRGHVAWWRRPWPLVPVGDDGAASPGGVVAAQTRARAAASSSPVVRNASSMPLAQRAPDAADTSLG